MTIPAAALRAAGLRPGDLVEIESAAFGSVTLRRAVNPYLDAAGSLTGAFPAGHLDEMRDEWDR